MKNGSFFNKKTTLNVQGKLLKLDSPLVMGILNITPDSFYDGGKYDNESSWIAQTERMLKDGASIIDIGAVSTRPGSDMLSEEEELLRLIPVIESLTKHFSDIIISVDTFRANVANEAVNHRAGIINDISAGDLDSKMFEMIARLRVPYIMMHMQGKPDNMQNTPKYKSVVKEVIGNFAKKLEQLHLLGVNDVILDPGFGFGKSVDHNFELLAELKQFQIFDLPIMVGVSRKSMINKALNINPKDALNGTTVLNTIALMNGANILRVHDVKEAVEAVKLFNNLSN